MTTLIAEQVAFQILPMMKPVIDAIAKHDRNLADQTRRATQSIMQNVCEGKARMGRDRTQLWRIAAGSARELLCALRIAEAWGYASVSGALVALVDREIRLLWGLTEPRARDAQGATASPPLDRRDPGTP